MKAQKMEWFAAWKRRGRLGKRKAFDRIWPRSPIPKLMYFSWCLEEGYGWLKRAVGFEVAEEFHVQRIENMKEHSVLRENQGAKLESDEDGRWKCRLGWLYRFLTLIILCLKESICWFVSEKTGRTLGVLPFAFLAKEVSKPHLTGVCGIFDIFAFLSRVSLLWDTLLHTECLFSSCHPIHSINIENPLRK